MNVKYKYFTGVTRYFNLIALYERNYKKNWEDFRSVWIRDNNMVGTNLKIS